MNQCFGYVKGLDEEFGYFMIKELESITGPFGLKVERDKFFTLTKVGDIPARYTVVLSKTKTLAQLIKVS